MSEGPPDAGRVAALIEHDRLDEAAALLQQALAQQPDALPWRWLRARLSYRRGDLRGAVRDLRHVLLLDPTRVEDHQRLAHALAELGRPQDAALAIAAAARAVPERSDLVALAAQSAFQVDRFDLAVGLYHRLDRAGLLTEDLLVEFALATWLTGDVENALGLYRRLAASPTPAHRARGELACGEILAEYGDLSGAALALQRAAQTDAQPFAQQATRLLIPLLRRPHTGQPAPSRGALTRDTLSMVDRAVARMTNPELASPDDALRWLRLHNRKSRPDAPAGRPRWRRPADRRDLLDAWRRLNPDPGLAILDLRATALFVRQLAALTPWRLYDATDHALVLTERLTAWLQQDDRPWLEGLSHAADRLLAHPLHDDLAELADASPFAARTCRLIDALGLDHAAQDLLALLVAPDLAPRHHAWRHALGLPNRNAPLDLLATVVDPHAGHTAALRPTLARDRFAAFVVREVTLEGHRRERINPANWLLDHLRGDPVCPWFALDPRLLLIRPDAEDDDAPPRAALRAIADALSDEPRRAVLQTLGRYPSVELRALSNALPHRGLVLVPADLGLLGEQASAALRIGIVRQSTLDGVVVAFELPDTHDANAIAQLSAAFARDARSLLLWSPDPAHARRAARSLDAPWLRLDLNPVRPDDWSAIGTQAARPYRVLRPNVPLDDLLLDDEARQSLQNLLQFVRRRDQLLDGWGYGRAITTGRAASALIHGPSGTGKTLATRAIATALDLPIFEVDVSRVLSRYIGEAEKKLAAIFDDAEDGAVLVFDGADALFAQRTQVKRSAERYANLQVNYLLQRIEDFSGIILLTAEQPSALDDAFARRLRFQIRLEPPDLARRLALWRHFIRRAPTSGPLHLERLATLEIHGGLIEAAALMAATLSMRDGLDAIDFQHLWDGLVRVMRAEGYLIPDRPERFLGLTPPNA